MLLSRGLGLPLSDNLLWIFLQSPSPLMAISVYSQPNYLSLSPALFALSPAPCDSSHPSSPASLCCHPQCHPETEKVFICLGSGSLAYSGFIRANTVSHSADCDTGCQLWVSIWHRPGDATPWAQFCNAPWGRWYLIDWGAHKCNNDEANVWLIVSEFHYTLVTVAREICDTTKYVSHCHEFTWSRCPWVSCG